MIRKTVFCCFVCLSSGMMTSCADMDGKKDESVIIEPPSWPMFQFDEQGVPHRWQFPMLSPEMQANVRNETIGYGWKWMQTFEILEDGNVRSEDYYAEILGLSPASYYFVSDKEMFRYYYSDVVGKAVYSAQGFAMEPATGILTDSGNLQVFMPGSFYLHIWGIYQLSGKWYMTTIEPLAQRADESGEFKTVWGTSQYYRMNEAELQQMQAEYSSDYSQIK